MGEPVGKGSRRTSHRMSTHIPGTWWISLRVKSSRSLKMSAKPPFEALESGLPMAVNAGQPSFKPTRVTQIRSSIFL